MGLNWNDLGLFKHAQGKILINLMPVDIIFRMGVTWNAGVDETKVRLIFIEAYDVGHL